MFTLFNKLSNTVATVLREIVDGDIFDGKVIELEEVVSKLRWDIIGLSEVRREGEDSIILESGNLFYYREGDQQSQGGVGFIVHESLSRPSFYFVL
ncbi:jg22737 [Pararge aegeria aegeria]|uniref:Jg22737 protein n=1 Tax=Pararge aegeria aegeria TaxID=348720 RepID=A0A8S4QRQ2_9NEOP|nr:jg22737 [Pararge aegeria aegeria]